MSVLVEKVSAVERRLTIVVPVEQLDQAYDQKINKAARTANIKGYRPGKAPVSVIRQRFGAEARNEALGEVIQSAYFNAIQTEKLHPVGAPEITPKTMEPNKPLEFIATIEVLPEIEKVAFSLTEVKKPKTDVTDHDVFQVLEKLKKQHAKMRVVDREAKLNDRVVADYHLVDQNGQADLANKVTQHPIELGSNTMIPGFEEGLIGAKAGDEITLNLTFPKDFSIKEKAGQPAQFVVQIKQVYEADIPALDANFIKKLGLASGKEDELRAQIQKSLEQERDRLVREKVKEQVFKHLLETNPIEIPKALVTREANHIHDEMHPHHGHEHHHSDDEMKAFEEIAKKRVTLGLLIGECAKKWELKVDQARVLERMNEIASVYEKPAEVLEWLSSSERRPGIEAQILEEQTMEKFLENVSIKEENLTFSELKGINPPT